MDEAGSILVGRDAAGSWAPGLALRMANRHGLIAGATGTGKTVTLQVLAEGFARNGVPVFLADVKGDLSGISQVGGDNPKARERAAALGLEDWRGDSFPVIYWDLFGRQGHPIRTTVSEMGPLLLANLLELNDVQEGVLNIAFRLADEQGLLLLDLKDLRAILTHIADDAAEISTRYGNVAKATVGAVQRQLLVLENQGAAGFFGEPALELADFMRVERAGYGFINVLAADKLIQSPRLYASFLLWLLAELFEDLPEVGDPERPKLVFFFDEAHLLFDGAPKALLEKIEQVVRLIRSKGVGVYFVTQDPLDVPDSVLGQLGNRVQHALRAFTPRDQKAVKVAAETFRPNPAFDAAAAITELGVGEALVSTLDAKGAPSPVERVLIVPPTARIGAAKPEERQAVEAESPVKGKYETPIDRESAYELLTARASAEPAAPAPHAPPPPPPERPAAGPDGYPVARDSARGPWRSSPAPRASGRPRETVTEAFAKSAVRAIGSSVGRQIVRGLLGAMLKGR
ncbi:MAG TPA: helicase HerA-like domain-containing protein [Dongiaceae bacterium]|nr:helicase HerA-like domain-containing protein [Dongiaceae bacterium]